MKLQFLLVSFFFIAFNTAYCQDRAFFNPNQSLVLLNPSFAGCNGSVRNQSSFNSWLGFPPSAYTAVNSLDAFISSLNAGIAVTALTDYFGKGVLIDNKLSFSYAQYFLLLKGKLKVVPSLQLAYVERNINLGTIWTPSGPVKRSPIKINYLDLSMGFLATYKNKLYVGFQSRILTIQITVLTLTTSFLII